MTTTIAREEASRLANLLRREHHALAEFLVALADFDRRQRWESLGHKSLFEFLRRELRFFGLSSRDAAFLAASIRPVENPPRRDFLVTQVRPHAAPEAATPACDPTAGSLLLQRPK
jgi:hypothetical protein